MTPYKDILPATYVANLRHLSRFLRGVMQEGFDMDYFVRLPGSEAGEYGGIARVVNECGSVCCAVGHGPLAGFAPLQGETWDQYSDRLFLPDYGEVSEDAAYEKDAAWMWCFASLWKEQDNTPSGAADRIDWLLDKGLPENAQRQRWGENPLCYREVSA